MKLRRLASLFKRRQFCFQLTTLPSKKVVFSIPDVIFLLTIMETIINDNCSHVSGVAPYPCEVIDVDGIRISKDIWIKLKMDRHAVVSVHSVYDDVINAVGSDKTLISILNHGKPLVPMGIVLNNGLVFQSLKKYSILTIGFAEQADVDLSSETEVCDLFLYPHAQDRSKVIAAHSKLLDFLQRSAPVDSFFSVVRSLHNEPITDTTDSWEIQSRKIIVPRLKSYLKALCQNSCIHNNLNIYGFGRGLTPSSDDFILGISAVLQYTGDARLNEIIRHGEGLLETTTFMSSQMLRNAWNGHYHMFIHQLFQAIEAYNLSEKVLFDVSSFGHTSGIDTLCGILIGMEVTRENSIWLQ